MAKAPVGSKQYLRHSQLSHPLLEPQQYLPDGKRDHDAVRRSVSDDRAGRRPAGNTTKFSRRRRSCARSIRSRPTCARCPVGTVSDLAFPLKLRHQFVNGDDPKFFIVQDTHQALGEAIMGMSNEEPGVFDWLFSEDYSATVVIAYVSTTDPRRSQPADGRHYRSRGRTVSRTYRSRSVLREERSASPRHSIEISSTGWL